MNELANSVREKAAATVLRLTSQEVTRETDPIFELVGFLSQDDVESGLPPANDLIPPAKWLAWNQFALMRAESLSLAVTEVLERERTDLPDDLPALRAWAANLVLMTLDHLRMG